MPKYTIPYRETTKVPVEGDNTFIFRYDNARPGSTSFNLGYHCESCEGFGNGSVTVISAMGIPIPQEFTVGGRNFG